MGEEPPARAELVNRASELMLGCVTGVFDTMDFHCAHLHIWYREIRDFFWREEIKVEHGELRPEDIIRWTRYWQDMARESVDSKRIR